LDIKADPDAPALASAKVLVEDFLPERIEFDLSLPDAPIGPTDTPPLSISAKYLFGAPAAELPINGTVRVSAVSELSGFPGYRFGQYDAPVQARSRVIESAGRTDGQGKAVVALALPDMGAVTAPLQATAVVTLSEGSGRPVERRLTKALTPAGAMIGLKPLFDGVIERGTQAQFNIIGIGRDLKPEPMTVRWTLNRIETRYQWFQLYGDWDWEPITTRTRAATGQVTLSDGPFQIEAPVDWGRYELIVERLDGPYLASSTDFYAGWYAPADASSTPDTLDVSLDRPSYKTGETAKVTLVPRYAGTALISVMSNRLIHMETVPVTAGETVVPLTVTDDWGAGAYAARH